MGNVAIAASSNISLNESPSEKEGKCGFQVLFQVFTGRTLNESPSEKEGKLECHGGGGLPDTPSMKVPPKRKGNDEATAEPVAVTPLNESPSKKEGK